MKARALLFVLAILLPAAPASAAPDRQVQRGLELFGRYCVSCHGPNGAGIPDKAPSLHGVGARGADFYLSTGYMPLPHVGLQPRRSRHILGPAQIDALIAYVASLGHGPPVPTPHLERGDLSLGQHLFTTHCSGCHQVVAAGGFVTGAVAPPLTEATPIQIAEAVRIGPYVMPVFDERQISNRQLDSIIRYVDYAKHPDDRGGWALGHVGPVPEGLVTWFLAASTLVALCLVIGRRLRG
jgi:ubiquinol-cytochrome c reductase cytochrome c subunit